MRSGSCEEEVHKLQAEFGGNYQRFAAENSAGLCLDHSEKAREIGFEHPM
jgi:hypothetical protein